MENAELIKALRCKECFDLCNVENCRYHLTNTKSGCKCAIKLMATDAADALEAADKRIAELEAAQRWISAEDPPKYTGDYNVVCNIGSMLGGYTDVRTYRFERFKGQEPKWCIPNRFDEIVSVTHWQALPQPPQKGEME